jgi:A/G-specific adenine glycosylase
MPIEQLRETPPDGYFEPFSALLDWYRRAHRDLPWRRTSDPYAILVSEIMLQQTRVETVIPYFLSFLQRFPNAESLAGASLADVYEHWAGLGYYRRAQNLQRAAQAIVARGAFPQSAEELRELPGVGDYTAAAVASIAFQTPALALDGNAVRVLSRLFGIAGEAGSATLMRRLRQSAEPLLPRQSPGDFTQAVMELGATCCSPRRPACHTCPLQLYCRAHAQGTAESIPAAKKRRTVETLTLYALDIRHQGRALLERGQNFPFLRGQWTPPLFTTEQFHQALSTYQGRYPGQPMRRGQIQHSITFRKLTIEIWGWETEAGTLDEERIWHPWQPDSSRLPRLTSKVLGYSP